VRAATVRNVSRNRGCRCSGWPCVRPSLRQPCPRSSRCSRPCASPRSRCAPSRSRSPARAAARVSSRRVTCATRRASSTGDARAGMGGSRRSCNSFARRTCCDRSPLAISNGSRSTSGPFAARAAVPRRSVPRRALPLLRGADRGVRCRRCHGHRARAGGTHGVTRAHRRRRTGRCAARCRRDPTPRRKPARPRRDRARGARLVAARMVTRSMRIALSGPAGPQYNVMFLHNGLPS